MQSVSSSASPSLSSRLQSFLPLPHHKKHILHTPPKKLNASALSAAPARRESPRGRAGAPSRSPGRFSSPGSPGTHPDAGKGAVSVHRPQPRQSRQQMDDTDGGECQQCGFGGRGARSRFRALLLHRRGGRRLPPCRPYARSPQPQPGRVEPRHEGQHGAVKKSRPPAVKRHRRDQLVHGTGSRTGSRHFPRNRKRHTSASGGGAHAASGACAVVSLSSARPLPPPPQLRVRRAAGREYKRLHMRSRRPPPPPSVARRMRSGCRAVAAHAHSGRSARCSAACE